MLLEILFLGRILPDKQDGEVLGESSVIRDRDRPRTVKKILRLRRFRCFLQGPVETTDRQVDSFPRAVYLAGRFPVANNRTRNEFLPCRAAPEYVALRHRS